MAWADANYTHKKKITIQIEEVAGAETDFPICIEITDADLTGCLASGHDIKFYNDDEDTQLKHERVEWNNATGYLVAWVKIPTLSGVADTELYMYYEYGAEGVDQADPTNVWDSDYMAVFHCNETTGDLIDSTSNGNDFTAINTAGITYRQSGQVGYSIYTPASTLSKYYFNNTDFDMTSCSESTLEGWVLPQDKGGTSYAHFIFSIQESGSDDIRLSCQEKENLGANQSGLNCCYDDGVSDCVSDYTHDVTDGFHYYAATQTNADTGTLKGYFDGVNTDTNNTTNFSYNALSKLARISHRVNSTNVPNYGIKGYFDELRVSTVVRGDNWIETCYNNHSLVGTDDFTEWGSEESQGAAGETHTPTDNPNADDNITFVVGYFLEDNATATNIFSVLAGKNLEDNPTATDEITSLVAEKFLSDNPKASDYVTFSIQKYFSDNPTASDDVNYNTFTITGETEVIGLGMPIWDGENREINKNLNIINFWTDELEALDKGKQSEPLHLVGIETGKATDTYSIVTKFQNVWDMMNNHEEVTIAGLGTCMNGVYIIKNFSFETVPGSRVAFKWTLILEFVRTL